MEYKLNSLKTFKDRWVFICIGMIIALFAMLLPLCWGNWQGEEQKAESETETAWISEVWTPWQLTEDGDHQLMPPISESISDSHERFKEMAAAYGLDASKIWTLEEYYWLTEWLALCLIISETSWWHRGYGTSSCNNLGNVWNNDRGNRVCYAFMETWLEKVWMTLTNSNLWRIQTLGCLSNAWSCQSWDDRWYRYATSNWNWQKNMVACLSQIYWSINPATFNIRQR